LNYTNTYLPTQHIRAASVLPAGLCWVLYTPFQNIKEWPQIDPLTGMAFTSFILKPDTTWYYLKIVDNDRFFTEAQRVSAAGIVYEQSIAGWLPGNTPGAISAMHTAQFNRHVVLFKDKSGQSRFIGHPDRGSQILFNYNSGNPSDARKRNISINCVSRYPAVVYTGISNIVDSDVITPPSELGKYFSGAFDDSFS
jgi:hypothetical protein